MTLKSSTKNIVSIRGFIHKNHLKAFYATLALVSAQIDGL
jgi:hypothetical protein